MRFYLDSNVWIDYLDVRRGDHEKAVKLFEEVRKRNHVIVFSRVHHKEMRNAGYFEGFEKLKNELFKSGFCWGVSYSEGDYQVAQRHDELLRVGYSDILHVIIAKSKKALPVSSDAHWKTAGEALGVRVYDYEDLGITL